MKILRYPHPALLTVCTPVSAIDMLAKELLDEMWETMVANEGIGLAANQVGVTLRMFVMKGHIGEKLFFINPKILSKSIAPAEKIEGCLSAPGEYLKLDERAEWVQVQFQDETGAEHIKMFTGIHSVCVQHEIDHLDGKTHLMSKTLSSKDRKMLAKKWGLSK